MLVRLIDSYGKELLVDSLDVAALDHWGRFTKVSLKSGGAVFVRGTRLEIVGRRGILPGLPITIQ
jgi:hypothetical protein